MNSNPMNCPGRGFTLVEILVVVAIVGILAAIAVPNYADYVRRGKITEATGALADMRIKMEQYYQDRRTYVEVAGAGWPCTATGYLATVNARLQEFTVNCGTPAAAAYTLSAVGRTGMTGFTFTINEANVKATTAVPSGWKTSTTCWVGRKNGDCL